LRIRRVRFLHKRLGCLKFSIALCMIYSTFRPTSISVRFLVLL
jgi:hypothetical protein